MNGDNASPDGDACITRRTAEGLSDRDTVRCLKRHVANKIFALLTQNPAVALPIGT